MQSGGAHRLERRLKIRGIDAFITWEPQSFRFNGLAYSQVHALWVRRDQVERLRLFLDEDIPPPVTWWQPPDPPPMTQEELDAIDYTLDTEDEGNPNG